MRTTDPRTWPKPRALRFAAAASAVVAAVACAFAATGVTVSQKDQRFAPGTATITLGEPLTIVNDDGPTVHHVYVESDAFNYDSGDQLPGKRATIMFPARGRYTVLCGIHPKMKLDVTVK